MSICHFRVVLVLLFLATGCASTDSRAIPAIATETTPTTSIGAPHPSISSVDSGSPASGVDSDTAHRAATYRDEALSFLAAEIEADLGCVQDRFAGVESADLDAAGIRATGVAEGMWDGVIADADNPVQDSLMLTVSLCTEFFEELIYEDLADQLTPEELDCIVRVGSHNPEIVVLHMAGTRDGATVEEVYPEAMVAKLLRGQIARYEILTNMRMLGECPTSPGA